MIRKLGLGLMVAAAAAYGYLGEVVNSFAWPGPNIKGLGMSTTTLYALDLGSTSRVYLLNPTTGSVLGSWITSWGNANTGLDYGNGYLWIAAYSNNYIRWCNPASGSVYGSWAISAQRDGLAPNCTGDGGAGMTSLFSCGYTTCYNHNLSTGSILASFNWPATMWDRDIAYDWRNHCLWKPDYATTIAAYTTSGSRITSFAGPADWNYGMAYMGEYLWVAGSTHYIYRIHCPGTLAVTPASLGRVKAAYR